jgi:nicotinamide riboside kinase
VRESNIPSTRDLYLMSTSDIGMQQAIMKAQLEQERAARTVAGSGTVRVVLSDRSAVDPVAYAVITAANEEDARGRMQVLVGTLEFQAALHRYRQGTFVLFKPVPEWLVDDGVRTMEKQDQTLEVFRNILKELGIPYVELGEEIKDLQARVAFAIGLINPNGTDASSLKNGVVVFMLWFLAGAKL